MGTEKGKQLNVPAFFINPSTIPHYSTVVEYRILELLVGRPGANYLIHVYFCFLIQKMVPIRASI